MPVEMDKKQQIHFWYAMAALGLLFIFQALFTQQQQVEQIPYSQFIEMLDRGEIENVEVHDQRLTGKLRKPTADGREYFTTNRVEPGIADELAKRGVAFRGVAENTFIRDLLSWIVPVVFFFALWAFFIRRIAEKQGLGGMMTVGKSKAKVYVEKDTKVTFDDVAGQDEAKAELQEIVNFLRNPDQYGRLGARLPKGILLVGPPGTGKTLFARAVAGEAAVPFFSISGSEFVEMFVGVGAARVRDLFEQARKAAPCIIFIDELDALGRSRTVGGPMGGHDEKEQTLNQLLAELDGFDTSSGIVLLAATNRPEILDPALLRAGRFDRQVLVDRPDRPGRVAILKVHIRKVKLDPGVDLDQVAALTPGFTGADLANLVNEAAIIATRRHGEKVTLADFNAAIERIIAGIEKRGRLLNEQERKTVAYHEMGHALVASALPGMDPVHKVSIIPRGIGALGYTIQRPTEDRFLISSADLKNKMAVLMGGRAAEHLVFNEISTGAADDLEKITGIARDMVARYGMTDDEVGQVVYEEHPHVFLGEVAMGRSPRGEYSEETAREIDLAVRKLVDDAFATALQTLKRRRKDLDAGVKLLLEKEVLTADEFAPLKPQDGRKAAE